MTAKAGYLTPSLPVKDIEKSMRFYELLGLTTIDTDRQKPLGWARMHCEGGAVMFVRSEEPVDASKQAIILYMYTPELAALRDHLVTSGVKVSPIGYPHYMPSGELCVADPDGYIILVGQWGEEQQIEWEKRIGGKAEDVRLRAAGGSN